MWNRVEERGVGRSDTTIWRVRLVNNNSLLCGLDNKTKKHSSFQKAERLFMSLSGAKLLDVRFIRASFGLEPIRELRDNIYMHMQSSLFIRCSIVRNIIQGYFESAAANDAFLDNTDSKTEVTTTKIISY